MSSLNYSSRVWKRKCCSLIFALADCMLLKFIRCRLTFNKSTNVFLFLLLVRHLTLEGWSKCNLLLTSPCTSAATGFSAKSTIFTKKFTRSEKFLLDLKSFRRSSQLSLKWFSYILYSPKTFASIASLLKIDFFEARKISYQQSLGFLQELKTTTLKEYFRPINLTLIYLFL